MERRFPIKQGQPRGMAFTIFIPFPNSLHKLKVGRAMNRFVKNGTANLVATGWTDRTLMDLSIKIGLSKENT